VQAQVNVVVRALAEAGDRKAAEPEVYTTSIDRANYIVFVWRDTPLGDHLVLSTGPSFAPKVAFASMIPAEPGIGVYIQARLAERKDVRALAGAGRAVSRVGAATERAGRRETERETRAREATERRATRVPKPKPKPQQWVQAPAARMSRAPVSRRAPGGGEGIWEGPAQTHARTSAKQAQSEKAELLSGLQGLLGKLGVR
jgi:hypothetical protein